MHAQRSIRFLTPPSLGELKEHVRAELFAMALSQRIGRPVTVETTSSYEELISRVDAGEAELVWGSAEVCDRLRPRAHAILRAVRGGRAEYNAALICRAEEPLTLDRLSDTVAAWVAPGSSAGYKLPRAHLSEHGLEPDETFREQHFWKSYRRALSAVLDGDADVASVHCAHPDERSLRASLALHVGSRANELMPFAFTRSIPSDGLILTHAMPASLVSQVLDAVDSLGAQGAGLDPLLGPFDTESFALERPHAVASAGSAAPKSDGLVIIEVGTDLRCLRTWSQSGLVFGKRGDELAGRTLHEVLGREAAVPVASLVAGSIRNGAGGRIDFGLDSKEGLRSYCAEFALSSSTDPKGGSAGTLLLRDITDHREVEAQLYRLASWPLVNPDPVLEIDGDGSVHYANHAAHERFPGLRTQGADHPVVAAMLAVNRSPRRGLKSALREVEVDGHLWKITVVSSSDSDFIRAFVVDIRQAGGRDSRDELVRLLRRV